MKFRLCAVADLKADEIGSAVLPDGKKVAIFQVDGGYFVTEDVCTHGQASLSEEGSLNGKIVECGWHFGAFDVTTGEPAASPCTEALRTYPAVLEGQELFVELETAP